ncbi:MAG: DUF4026 domain-containing protein [Phycisphaerales bacterium]
MTHDRDTPADATSAVISEVEPWALPEPEPTTLIALWPGDEPPTQLEILAALSSAADQNAQVLEELSPDEPDVPWAIVIRMPSRPVALNIWTEPARELPPDETDAIGAADCKWIVGVETLLEPGDPLDHFVTLMRLVTGALESSPAILDVNTTQWHTRQSLAEQFNDPSIEPPIEVLWVIQAVSRNGDGQRASAGWLHTHGLWRCGKPELEMLEVPPAYTIRACELLNTIAGRLFEEPPPAPGEEMMIGYEMAVILQPWQDVAPYLADDTPGSMRDRADENDNAHTGVRAVVCDPNPRGAYRRLWVWPKAALDRLGHDDAVLYSAKRVTQRQASIARATWPDLAMTFSSLSGPLLRTDDRPADDADEPAVRFIIKAGLALRNQRDGDREHLWFVVRRFDADRAEAQLVNQPIHLGRMKKGDITWIERETVSDWSVITPQGSFGPARLGQMRQAIDQLREGVVTT